MNPPLYPNTDEVIYKLLKKIKLNHGTLHTETCNSTAEMADCRVETAARNGAQCACQVTVYRSRSIDRTDCKRGLFTSQPNTSPATQRACVPALLHLLTSCLSGSHVGVT